MEESTSKIRPKPDYYCILLEGLVIIESRNLREYSNCYLILLLEHSRKGTLLAPFFLRYKAGGQGQCIGGAGAMSVGAQCCRFLAELRAARGHIVATLQIDRSSFKTEICPCQTEIENKTFRDEFMRNF